VRALVLNATYEPLSVISARRAVVLVLREKAELVEPQDAVWRSERLEIKVPSVVRLVRYVRVPYARRVPLTRRAVFARDDHRCQYCDGPAENLDHVLPRARGGMHTWDNVVACCRPCNLRKGSRLPGEVGLELRRVPRPPNRGRWLYAHAGPGADPTWQRYLLAESA
jgi:5-methylcytosine-specific restriction endonuclease McrA